MIFDKYPYTNFHEMNDDWIIQTLREFGKRLDDFVAANSLTYADPIGYDPATTYPAYTVVIYNDTAYMSKVTAPAGVPPTNDNYYLKIFPFGDLITQMVNEGVNAGVTELTERVDQYLASAGEEIDAAIANIPLEVAEWMDNHPEITTPIPNESVSYPKLTGQLRSVLQFGRIPGSPTDIPNTDFSQGSINPSTGMNMPANNVCRTDFYSFDAGVLTVRGSAGYSVKAYAYLNNGTYIGIVNPAIGSDYDAFAVNAGSKYRFSIMKSDQSDFTPNDLPNNPIKYREFLPNREWADAVAAMKSAIAPEYSSANTYNVDDYVFYSGVLYRCVTAITTAEAWTAAHWTAAVLGGDVAEVMSAINKISDNVSDISYSKNLYNKDEPNVLIGYIMTGTNPIIKANSTTRTIYVKCKPNTTYTVSKIVSTRFSVAYANQLPVVGASIYGVISNAARSAITITTGDDAAYLVVFVWNGGTDTLTFDEISATIQVEEGATATDYTPFELTAVDYVARNEIQEMHEGLEIQVPDNNIVLGANLIPDMSNMTGEGGSTYDSTNNKWDLPFGGGISQSISVVKGYYLIQITEVIGSQDFDTSIDPNLQYSTITYSLGNDSYKGYALIDSNFVCVLYASTAGTAMFKIELPNNLSLSIDSVSVRHVDKRLVSPAKFDTASIMVSNDLKLIGIGGQKLSVFGLDNTCFGHNAQSHLDAGSNNTAIGAFAQTKIRSGQGNTAVGNRAQANMQMGTFNNAFGTVAQGNGNFEGSWNNAFGNEAQRDITTGSNNTAMGRRAQSLITTGNDNTAIGSFAGFAQHNANISDGSYATKTASYQTLIGAESIQGTPNTEPQDYATALGYYTRANEKALALGALAQATGEKSVAIGYGVHATHDHEVVIGDSESILVICGKRIVFNSDHTVTWEDVT